MHRAITRICFVRHGETDWNAGRRIQGQIDSSLNADGIAQAEAVARALAKEQFTAIYSSDLARARDTAELIALHHALTINLCVDLRERAYGSFQGLTYSEAEERYPEAYARFHRRELDEDFNGGESLRAFHGRVSRALELIAASGSGMKVLVVAHGGVLDIAYRMATAKALHAPRDFQIPNATVSWISRNAAGWELISWNQSPGDALDELPG